jgi:TolB-like protein/Flp pilus assembly protein TadD
MSATRRLAAILAADVAGYSRLMGTDEEGTLERLKALRVEVIDPKISEHHGRIVKTTGDGLLIEFASVVDAVRCATGWQAAMADHPQSADTRIDFRIGVNLGDIIIDGDDIFGDGVNIAARLEAMAEPGGVCVSGAAHDQVRDKLDLTFDDIGDQQVKNIARPVHVYRIPLQGGVKAAAPATPLTPHLAPRLSIVVLPFANLSSDAEQQYFADAITEDLTADLSRIADMLVISRNTAFTYRAKPVDTKQIGRELGVRYLLEGSVQRSGNRVRVTAQLIDAETDAHLWAERFTGDTGDLFALQDEITSRIAVELNLELVAAEAARPTEHPDVLDYIFWGRAARSKPRTPDNYAETICLFRRALALDPHSAEAQSWLAITLTSRVVDYMAAAGTAAADIAVAEDLAGRALVEAPRTALAHYAKAEVLRAQLRYEEAIPEFETAIAFDRNWANAYSHVGWCKSLAGSIEEMIPAQEQAIRLSPRDPLIRLWHMRIGLAHLIQSRTDDAILWLEKARSALSVHPPSHAYLASAYGLKGERVRAAAELAEARRLISDPDRYSSITRLKSIGYFGVPNIRALFEATYFVGLRKAGMPEE